MSLSLHKGFTLVELMVVIAIITILATIMPSISKMYFERAKQAQTKIAMRNIQQAIEDARINMDLALRYITLSWCSDCSCRPPGSWWAYTGSLLEVSDTHVCAMRWFTAIDRIFILGWHDVGEARKYHRDPWNVPYLLDENEGELPASCDYIKSSFWATGWWSWWSYGKYIPRLDGKCP